MARPAPIADRGRARARRDRNRAQGDHAGGRLRGQLEGGAHNLTHGNGVRGRGDHRQLTGIDRRGRTRGARGRCGEEEREDQPAHGAPETITPRRAGHSDLTGRRLDGSVDAMRRPPRSRVTYYGAALLMVGGAAAIVIAGLATVGLPLFGAFAGAVFAAYRLAGTGPAAVAVAMSSLVSVYAFLPPYLTWSTHTSPWHLPLVYAAALVAAMLARRYGLFRDPR